VPRLRLNGKLSDMVFDILLRTRCCNAFRVVIDICLFDEGLLIISINPRYINIYLICSSERTTRNSAGRNHANAGLQPCVIAEIEIQGLKARHKLI
jgi:hypothetical protein